MGNVLVIGNGFDLQHKKQTRYSEFLSFMSQFKYGFDNAKIPAEVRNEIKELRITPVREASLYNFFVNQFEKSEGNSNWIDMERELKRLIHKLIEFVYAANNHQVPNRVRLSRDEEYWGSTPHAYGTSEYDNNIIDYKIVFTTLKSIFRHTIPGDTFWVMDRYVDPWGEIDLDSVLTQLSEELGEIERLLWYYLSVIEPRRRAQKIKYANLMTALDPDYVISFNYTSTCEEEYAMDRNDICYIHGRIDNKDSIVLGYDDSDGRLDDILFKKYYRRLMKETDTINRDRLYYRGSVGDVRDKKLVFFGHSLDMSDEDILKGLLEKHREIVICVLDDADRAKKTANLIKLINKNKVIERIRSGEISFKKISTV